MTTLPRAELSELTPSTDVRLVHKVKTSFLDSKVARVLLPVLVLAAAIGAGVTVLLGGTLVAAYGWSSREVTGPSNEQIGDQVFGTWVWPFELLSVLLLAALVAAVAIATTGHRRQEESS